MWPRKLRMAESDVFIYFFPGFPKMAHSHPPPGVGRVGTRGRLHPIWHQLGCRHSGEVEVLHTLTNMLGIKSKWAYDLYFPYESKIYKLGDQVGADFSFFQLQGLGVMRHGMHGGGTPTTPPCDPVTQAPGIMGVMDANILAYFLIFWHWHMPPKCLAFLMHPIPITCGLQRVLTGCHLPWVLAMGGCPHICRWPAPYDNTWGL